MAMFQVTGTVTFKDGRVATVFDFQDISAASMDDAAEKAKRRAASDLGVDDALIEIKTVSIADQREVPRMQDGGIVESHTVYAVVENMPGYLPESDPTWFDTRSEAESYAAEREGELDDDSAYVVDIIEETSTRTAEELNDEMFGFAHGGIFPKYQEGAAVVEDTPDGVPAIIGEAGPEAVIPLDDPAAVEVMAEAIEEGGANGGETEAAAEAVEAAAEATEAAAEAVAVVATADAMAEVADAETEQVEAVAEAAAEVAHEETEATEAEAAAVEEVAEDPSVEVASLDTSPEESHWFFRRLARR